MFSNCKYQAHQEKVIAVVWPRASLKDTEYSSSPMESFIHFLFSQNQITWVDGSSGFIAKLNVFMR